MFVTFAWTIAEHVVMMQGGKWFGYIARTVGLVVEALQVVSWGERGMSPILEELEHGIQIMIWNGGIIEILQLVRRKGWQEMGNCWLLDWSNVGCCRREKSERPLRLLCTLRAFIGSDVDKRESTLSGNEIPRMKITHRRLHQSYRVMRSGPDAPGQSKLKQACPTILIHVE